MSPDPSATPVNPGAYELEATEYDTARTYRPGDPVAGGVVSRPPGEPTHMLAFHVTERTGTTVGHVQAFDLIADPGPDPFEHPAVPAWLDQVWEADMTAARVLCDFVEDHGAPPAFVAEARACVSPEAVYRAFKDRAMLPNQTVELSRWEAGGRHARLVGPSPPSRTERAYQACCRRLCRLFPAALMKTRAFADGQATAFVRAKLREDGLARRILPPEPVE